MSQILRALMTRPHFVRGVHWAPEHQSVAHGFRHLRYLVVVKRIVSGAKFIALVKFFPFY